MTDKEGILRMQPSGRWAVCRPGQASVEIASGEVFRAFGGALVPIVTSSVGNLLVV
jgi:hypothetical protein